jgi:hypothetical protein
MNGTINCDPCSISLIGKIYVSIFLFLSFLLLLNVVPGDGGNTREAKKTTELSEKQIYLFLLRLYVDN